MNHHFHTRNEWKYQALKRGFDSPAKQFNDHARLASAANNEPLLAPTQTQQQVR